MNFNSSRFDYDEIVMINPGFDAEKSSVFT